MPSTRPAARSSALRARAQARLDRLAEGVTSDFGIAGAIAAKAAPLRAVCRALGLAFDGWTIREIQPRRAGLFPRLRHLRLRVTGVRRDLGVLAPRRGALLTSRPAGC